MSKLMGRYRAATQRRATLACSADVFAEDVLEPARACSPLIASRASGRGLDGIQAEIGRLPISR